MTGPPVFAEGHNIRPAIERAAKVRRLTASRRRKRLVDWMTDHLDLDYRTIAEELGVSESLVKRVAKDMGYTLKPIVQTFHKAAAKRLDNPKVSGKW